ncbi:MAG: ADP-ribosylglycohydrolase family protein [Roseovarius pacificus]|nr:ADP-ribosylglycohydrolase family protein [Roseovarius pacificus]
MKIPGHFSAEINRNTLQMQRTSASHPLQIAEIRALEGVIGLTFCPGKKGDSVLGAPWDRDLDTDLQAIKAWGASKVITLMERHEFDLLSVRGLGEAIQRLGIDWVHLPIRDVSVPDESFPHIWANLTKDLQRSLARGQRILLHCRGGLGRTGLVAALLLMDLGLGSDDAMRRIRSVRPGAIETKEQETHVQRYMPYLCHASILAGAIGDSLGADIEFSSLTDIRARFPSGIDRLARTNAFASGWFTDDTQMTLFTAEGLMRAHIRGKLKGISSVSGVVHHALIRWYLTQGGTSETPHEETVGLVLDKRMWHQAAPGMTCMTALRGAKFFGEQARNDSKGCGTIMRVAPVAFGVERENVRQVAIETSALTHGHAVGQLAAAAWAEILADVSIGKQPEDAARSVAHRYQTELGQAGEIIASSIYLSLDAPVDGTPETVERLGGGWVAEEALSIALYAACVGKNFEEGLCIAVTHSGDSDSTGAIAGNLLGILYPDQVFAHRWKNEVGGADLILPLALDLPQARYWEPREASAQFENYPGF